MVFVQPQFCVSEATLGWEQPGLLGWISLRIKPANKYTVFCCDVLHRFAIWHQTEMNEWGFRPWFYHYAAILGWRQPGLVTSIPVWTILWLRIDHSTRWPAVQCSTTVQQLIPLTHYINLFTYIHNEFALVKVTTMCNVYFTMKFIGTGLLSIYFYIK